MLKEIGASGQLSLGKRFAKQLFDVTFHADGRIELIPMRAVALVRPAPAALMTAPDGWLPPGGYAGCSQWALDNRAALDAYAARIDHDGTAAEQLQQFLQAGDSSAASG
jgi:hypothetical protein